jgi:hypothetical protein
MKADKAPWADTIDDTRCCTLENGSQGTAIAVAQHARAMRRLEAYSWT